MATTATYCRSSFTKDKRVHFKNNTLDAEDHNGLVTKPKKKKKNDSRRNAEITEMYKVMECDEFSEEYEVESILNHRMVNGHKELQYWLKWKGYPDSDNTWEPESNLNCFKLLQKYKKDNNLLPSKPTKTKTLTKKTPSKAVAKGRESANVHHHDDKKVASTNQKKAANSSLTQTNEDTCMNPPHSTKIGSLSSVQEKCPSIKPQQSAWIKDAKVAYESKQPKQDHMLQTASKSCIATEPQILCAREESHCGVPPNGLKQNGFHIFPHQTLSPYPTSHIPTHQHHSVYIPGSGFYVVYVNSPEKNGRTMYTHSSTPYFNPVAQLTNGFDGSQIYSPPSPPISPLSSPLIVGYTPPRTKNVPLSLQLQETDNDSDCHSESHNLNSSLLLENSDLKLHLSSPSTCSTTSTPGCSPVRLPLTFPPINPLFLRQSSPLTSPLVQQQFLCSGSPIQSVLPTTPCTPTRLSEPQHHAQVSLLTNYVTTLNRGLEQTSPSVAIKRRNGLKPPTFLHSQQKGGGAPMPLPRSLHKQQEKCSVPTKAAKSCSFDNSELKSDSTKQSSLNRSTKVSHTVGLSHQETSTVKNGNFKVIAAHPTQPKITIARIDPLADNAATLNYKNQLMEWQYLLNNQRGGTDEYIIVENDVDHEPPPKDFTYISSNMYRDGVPDPSSPEVMGTLCGCECYIRGKKCGQKSKICCSHMAGAPFAYTTAGKVSVEPGTPIFECNSQCLCPADCANRVVQHGRKIPLCVFRTSNGRGWGVKTIEAIKPKTFVTEYVGEVIVNQEAERRGKLYDAAGQTYLFDLDFEDENAAFTIDAAKYGNISHFFNHSCDPNLIVYSVWIDTLDRRFPRIAFFTTRYVSAGEELTFDYQMNHDPTAPANSRLESKTAKFPCYCGSKNCLGYIY